MPFTLSNVKEDLEDIGPRFDGAPDLEFRLGRRASPALDIEAVTSAVRAHFRLGRLGSVRSTMAALMRTQVT